MSIYEHENRGYLAFSSRPASSVGTHTPGVAGEGTAKCEINPLVPSKCEVLLYCALPLTMSFPVTKPPELVVQAKVKRVAKPRETAVFCDSFWAFMLDDYLEDFSEGGSINASKRRGLAIQQSEQRIRPRRNEKRREKEGNDVSVVFAPIEPDDVISAELDNLLADDKVIDEQRDEDAPESPIVKEDLDAVPRGSRVNESKSRELEVEATSMTAPLEQKMAKSTENGLEAVPEAKSSINKNIHHSASSKDQQVARIDTVGRRLRAERKSAMDPREKRLLSRQPVKSIDEVAANLNPPRGSPDQPLDLTKPYHHGLKDEGATNDESPTWMILESKRAEQEYSRRRIDRKEALQRIRALKARLQTVDP